MWKRVIAKAPGATASWNSGIRIGFRDRIPPSIPPASVVLFRSNQVPEQGFQNENRIQQVHRRKYHRHNRCYQNHGCCGPSLLDLPIASTAFLPNHTRQRSQFRAVSSTQNSMNNLQGKKTAATRKKKGPKPNSRHPKGKISIQELVNSMEITLEECSQQLYEECSRIRGIKLNKRQRLKPWIMALLIHRYDRGIRDMDELNRDSVYYDGGRNFSKSSNDNITNAAIATKPIDLRCVLTPEANEIDSYILALQDNTNPIEREKIREILRHQKLGLLAKEARRILIDREIPFRELVGLKNEARVRTLSKQDPSVFLSLFSRAFCISEKRKRQSRRQRRKNITDQGAANQELQQFVVGVNDFSHRRFHPPSLKEASRKKKRRKDLQPRNKRQEAQKIPSNSYKNPPKELQQKMRAMIQKNK